MSCGLDFLKGLPKELIVFIVGMLPLSELRGAIPLGLSLGLTLPKAFLWATLGNLSFIAPMLFLFTPLANYLRNFRIWKKFFAWLFSRTQKNAAKVMRYESLGLFLFVGIPLPMTGAWTGIIAATIFKIKFRYAFVAICLGVILAGIIVSFLCALGIITWEAIK